MHARSPRARACLHHRPAGAGASEHRRLTAAFGGCDGDISRKPSRHRCSPAGVYTICHRINTVAVSSRDQPSKLPLVGLTPVRRRRTQPYGRFLIKYIIEKLNTLAFLSVCRARRLSLQRTPRRRRRRDCSDIARRSVESVDRPAAVASTPDGVVTRRRRKCRVQNQP